MTEPNLFKIDNPTPPSPFSQVVLAMEGLSYEDGIPNLVISEAGCFQGDCYCCPDDGSGIPFASMVFNNGKFIYSTSRSELTSLFSGSILSGLGLISNHIGDISGEIDVSEPFPENYDGEIAGGIGESGCFKQYTIYVFNECGEQYVSDYCVQAYCTARYSVDCTTQKVLVEVRRNWIDGKTDDLQVEQNYYNLGDVPAETNISINNGCCSPCRSNAVPLCLMTKNSLVYEFTGFSDVFWERNEDFGGGWTSYQSWNYTGLSAFNLTYILPLYIAPCNIAAASIRYDLPGVISRGTGVITYNDILYLNGVIYSSINTIWNVEYFTNGVTPNLKIIEYNSGGGWVSCPQIGDYNCASRQVYGWKSKWDNETDDAFDDIASYNKAPDCGRILISRYYLLDLNLIRGTSLAYYANL